MESPPPYMAPKRKSNTGLIIGLIIGGVALCCILGIGAVVGGGFWAFNNAKPLAECSIAYSDVREAIRQYALEHDNTLPPADSWQDEVAPYYEKIAKERPDEREMLKPLPAGGLWTCEDGSGGKTGIAYNDDVAGKKMDEVEKSLDFVLFEIRQQNRNLHLKYEQQPETNVPKIFGQPRGWFVIRLTGEAKLLEKGRENPINMRTGKGK